MQLSICECNTEYKGFRKVCERPEKREETEPVLLTHVAQSVARSLRDRI